MRLLAADAERQVLDNLATPLEIEKFFDALRTMGRPQRNRERAFISSAIAKAHEQSIELTVIQQIEERDDVRAAAVGLGFPEGKRSPVAPGASQPGARSCRSSPRFRKRRYAISGFFVAARNLRAGAGDVNYYHPRVEAGVEG
ncbi:hypothetical protein BZM27_55095, partial [Paraburkholderia steynii]